MIISNSYVQPTQYVNKTNATASYTQNTKPIEEASSKLEQMQEKYKDIYTPIPETYSKADEELQTSKIYEAYPDYMSFQDYLKDVNRIYIEELGGKPIALGDVLTQDQIDKQALAYSKAAEPLGGEEAYINMIKGAQEIEAKYPVNKWGKNENVHNAKELARFENAAVYEGLERGKNIEEAQISARRITKKYMDMDFMRLEFRSDLGGLTYEPEPIAYEKIWDLRDSGISGRWEENNVYENDKAMIFELEKKLSQFDFMLDNKSIIEKANNKLSAQDRGYINHYEERLQNNMIPETQTALNIFNNYKIYDSVDIRI